MKNCKKHFVVALFVFLLGLFLAPDVARSQVIEVGATGGLSYYMGDINPRKPFSQSRLGFGAIVRYYDNTRWAFRFTYSYLSLESSDAVAKYRPERGLSFNTKVHDFSLVAEFNFLDYFTGSRRSKISPYLFGGVSFFTFNPKADDGTELYNILTDVDSYENIPADGEAKYNKFTLSLPFGMGVKYSLSKRIGVALEWRMNLAFTDWLDDCHAYYPMYAANETNVQYSDPTGFTNDGTGANDLKYIQRGNSSNNDWYGYLNVSVVYKFLLPKSKKCNAGADRNSYITY